MMLSAEDVRTMAKAIDLDIPEEELSTVASRLSSILDEVEELARTYERELERHDPIPSVAVDEEALS